MTFELLIVLAVLVEGIWESFKSIWQDNKIDWNRIGMIAVGVLVAFLVRIDIFAMIGYEITVPIVGIFLTGIILSRGSNYLHDITKVVRGLIDIAKSQG